MKTIILAFLLSTISFASDDLYLTVHGDGTYTESERAHADARVREFEKEFRNAGFVRLAERTTEALDAILYIAKKNLRKKGHDELALEIEEGWRIHRSTIVVMSLNMGRPIGSFDPISKWLSDIYEAIELKLGVEICRTLRISDIKTINHGLRVCFQPCTFGLAEFEYHFIHDDVYRGLFPVIIYWVSNISCGLMTAGMGYVTFICSPVSMLIELGADRLIAPWLAPKLYNLAGCE